MQMGALHQGHLDLGTFAIAQQQAVSQHGSTATAEA